MSSVEVTVTGVLYDKLARTAQQVVLIGEATLTGVGVGGGPIIPPSKPPVQPPVDPGYGYPEKPVDPGYGYPVGGPPRPAHPIYLPPGIWPNPPEGIAPLPEHPIVIPPPEGSPPSTPAFEVKVFWTPQTGWGVALIPQFPVPTPSAS